MIRNSLLGLVMLAFAAAGCNTKPETPRSDMPVKANDPIDTKTGKPRKTLDASLEEPRR